MVQMFMCDLKKVSALGSVRFRVSSLERFCYKGFFRNSSGTKFFVRPREVSALEDVRFREVPLYLNSFSSLHVFKPISDNFTYHFGKFPNSFKVKPQLETRLLFIVKK